jgi:glyoxylase I family protein
MAIEIRGMTPLLSVFDIPASIGFYCEALGFEVVGSDGNPAPHFDWAMLRLKGSELMLNTAYDEGERPPCPDPARIDAHRDVALYFGCPDVDGAYARLRASCPVRNGAVVSYRPRRLPALLPVARGGVGNRETGGR